MFKFKVNDTVKITSGKDKGREGVIEKIFPKKGTLLIPGIAVYKKHIKPAMTVDGKGGIFEISRPVVTAKVALICPNCKKQTRVSFKVVNGKKERICAKCKKTIKSKKPIKIVKDKK